MNGPKRIQRRRTKGWRMPEGAVYVGRPTIFGNPFRVIKSPCCRTWDVIDNNGVTYVIDHKWAHEHEWADLHRTGALKWARREAVRLFADWRPPTTTGDRDERERRSAHRRVRPGVRLR